MARTQKSINEDIKCKRDVLMIISSTKDALSLKDILFLYQAYQFHYSYPRTRKALKELFLAEQIQRKWSWGAKGNWEYRYWIKREDTES